MNYLQKKKLAFMSIVNRVKGFIRTVTGTFPLTLANCVDEESIIDYTISGASGGVGERTTNLFDSNKLSGGNGFVDYNGVQCYKYVDDAYNVFLYRDEFKENTRYRITLKIYCEEEKNTNIEFRYTDGTKSIHDVRTQGASYSFTSTSGKTIDCIAGTHSWALTRYLDLSVVQLVEGASSKTYEPYGYKIPITVSNSAVAPITTNIYLDEPLEAGQSVSYKRDNLPTIPTFKGTSILTVDTTIQPSNAEVTYYSTLKE